MFTFTRTLFIIVTTLAAGTALAQFQPNFGEPLLHNPAVPYTAEEAICTADAHDARAFSHPKKTGHQDLDHHPKIPHNPSIISTSETANRLLWTSEISRSSPTWTTEKPPL